MRNLIFGINLSIDGCCDHTKFNGDGDEMHEYFAHLMQNADLLVYGRKTYELMVPFWPDVAKNHSGETKAINEFAQTFDAINKVVFSKSLDRAEDKNTCIVRTDLKDEILKLKQEEGKNILLGGVDLPSQVIAMGLVDEYHFVVHPVIAGAGTRLLEGINLQKALQLKLVGSKVLKSGCIAVHYVKR
jgi:dihydrofolate reductase